MLPVELGLDVSGHVDVVDDDTLEVATEVDVAPIAVHDLQTADLAIADLEAGKVAQLDAGTTELVTVGVLSRHLGSFPHPPPHAPVVAAHAVSRHSFSPTSILFDLFYRCDLCRLSSSPMSSRPVPR